MTKPKRVSRYEQIGSSRVFLADLGVLRTAWRNDKLALCLGAGVSQPYGIPGWNELVLNYLLTKVDSETWREFHPHFRKALSEWMMDHLSVNPSTLARLFVQGDQSRFRERLREALYRDSRMPTGTSSLDAVVALIKRANEMDRKIAGIITLNYDDLLEQRLREAGIECSSLVGGERDESDGIAVIHVHGFLPESGDIPDQELILAESDYHRVMSSAFHWSTVTLGWHLRMNTVLFIGVSLRDPSIRRLLDGCRPPGSSRPHVILTRDYELEGDDLWVAVDQVRRRAEEYGLRMSRVEGKPPGGIEDIMRWICKKAQDYDRDVLKSFGVRAIRLRTYDDIPLILNHIGRR